MSILNFYHTSAPNCDFAVFAHNKKYELKFDLEKLSQELKKTGFKQEYVARYGNILSYFVVPLELSNVDSKFVFSGYLAHKGIMHIGQKELPKNICKSSVLESLDGYFTFAIAEKDKIIVSQDAFGKEMIFCHITDEFIVVSNRYHLLLIYLNLLGVKPSLNYNKILLMLCSEDATFSQQSATRDMFFDSQHMLTMNEKIVIDNRGFKITEKKRIADVWIPKENINQLFEAGIEELKDNGKAVFSKEWDAGIKVEVTGGWDSRISLASILSTGRRDFTVKTIVNNQSIGDMTVSELICKKFGLERGDPNYWPKIWWNSFDEMDSTYRSLLMGVNFQKVQSKSKLISGTKSIRVGGDSGEIYKGYYMNRYLSDNVFSKITLELLVDTFVKKYPFLPKEKGLFYQKCLYDILLDEFKAIPGTVPQEKINNHLLLYRLRAHFGNAAFQSFSCGFAWSPATSLYALEYHNSLPYIERYKRHPYIINADLAHAVYPELSDIPFTKGGVGNLHYIMPKGDAVIDITEQYKDVDTSAWDRVRDDSYEISKKMTEKYKNPNAYEINKEFLEHQDTNNVLQETLLLFDTLRQYSNEMSEILSTELRDFIANRGLKFSIDSYHNRLVMLRDMIEVFESISVINTSILIDLVPRLHYVSIFSKMQLISINRNGGKLILNNIIIDFSTSQSRIVSWQGNYSDENKFHLFSLNWLHQLFDEFEQTNDKFLWNFCEDLLQGYFGFLIWGGMNHFEERQQLVDRTEYAYALRAFLLARALILSPKGWFFAGNVVKILKQHGRWLSEHYAKTNDDDCICQLALLHIAQICANEDFAKKWKNLAFECLQKYHDRKMLNANIYDEIEKFCNLNNMDMPFTQISKISDKALLEVSNVYQYENQDSLIKNLCVANGNIESTDIFLDRVIEYWHTYANIQKNSTLVTKIETHALSGNCKIEFHSDYFTALFFGKMDSYQINYQFPEARIGNGISVRFCLSKWKKIRYIAVGYQYENVYRHVKIVNPRFNQWFDFSIGHGDIAFGLQNDWNFPPPVSIGNIRLYVSGEPEESGAIVDVAQMWCWKEACYNNENSVNTKLPIWSTNTCNWMPVKSEFLEIIYRYLNKCFKEADAQAEKFIAHGSCPLVGESILDWPIEASTPINLCTIGTHRFSWHALHPATILMIYARVHNVETPLFAAREFISNWLETSYFRNDPDKKYAWYDHGVAERLLSMLLMWAIGVERRFDKRFMSRLRMVIFRHGQLLDSELFYASHQLTRYHNHAWFQDLSLMAAALIFSDFPCSKRWLENALHRLSDQFDTLIVRDNGMAVFVENSIGYHQGVQRLVEFAGELVLTTGKKSNIPDIAVGLSLFSVFLSYPDNRAPAQGDTFRYANFSGNLISKRGSTYQEPCCVLLPRAGYGIVKGNHNDTPFMFSIFATSICRTHKHEDNLSFTLFFDGLEWLIDPSFYSHEYKTPLPSYLRSAVAHNALIILDTPYSIDPEKADISGTVKGNQFEIIGQHHAYQNVTISRHIYGCLDQLSLEFSDFAESQYHKDVFDPALYLMFHCGEHVEASLSGKTLILSHQNSSFKLYIELPSENTTKYHGVQKPDLIRGITGLGFMQYANIDTVECKVPFNKKLEWKIRVVDSTQSTVYFSEHET